MGQLGSNLGVNFQDKPKIVKLLATKNVIQIACGSYHSVALSNSEYYIATIKLLVVDCVNVRGC